MTVISSRDLEPTVDTLVRTPDGQDLAAQFTGAPSKQGIVFLHGILQAGLCWKYQMSSNALAEYRFAAFDLRGHGFSSKPAGPAHYHESRRWADDVLSVMNEAGIETAILVGWSYGGRVILDYLEHHGTDRISGLVFVDANTRNAEGHTSTGGAEFLKKAASDHLATFIEGRLGFAEACFHRQPGTRDWDEIIAYNMLTPPARLRDMTGRPLDRDGLMRSIDVPTLIIHGVHDALCLEKSARHTASVIPGSDLHLLPDVGHAPFLEDPETFNAELAAFAARAFVRA